MRSIVVVAVLAFVQPAIALAQARKPPPEPPTVATDPEIARCESIVRKTFRKSRSYGDLRFADAPETTEGKVRGKFTPRHPVDVSRIVKVAAEALDKKSNNWIEISLWCGYAGDRLVAADLIRPDEKW
jgi:hypothetical protein